jgi:hypothetical protein
MIHSGAFELLVAAVHATHARVLVLVTAHGLQPSGIWLP